MKWWIWLIIAVAVLILIGAISGNVGGSFAAVGGIAFLVAIPVAGIYVVVKLIKHFWYH